MNLLLLGPQRGGQFFVTGVVEFSATEPPVKFSVIAGGDKPLPYETKATQRTVGEGFIPSHRAVGWGVVASRVRIVVRRRSCALSGRFLSTRGGWGDRISLVGDVRQDRHGAGRRSLCRLLPRRVLTLNAHVEHARDGHGAHRRSPLGRVLLSLHETGRRTPARRHRIRVVTDLACGCDLVRLATAFLTPTRSRTSTPSLWLDDPNDLEAEV